MSDNMYDLDGWVEIPCVDSDKLRAGKKPTSSLTDPGGTFGPGVVYTEWAADDSEPVLRDYRWTDPERPCKHYVPAVTS